MRQGYFTGHYYSGTILFDILIIVVVIVVTIFISDYFRKRNHPYQSILLRILRDKYIRNEISAEDYRERSMMLNDEYWLDSNDAAMADLKMEYAKCEISSREYVERKEALNENAENRLY